MGSVLRFLTRSQVARLFGVSPHTVTRWANEERVPCIVTPGGQFRFPEDDILAMLGREKRKGEHVMAAKKDKGAIKLALCPRCGSELSSISDMDLAGPYVRCLKCGFTSDFISAKHNVVSDIEIQKAAAHLGM